MYGAREVLMDSTHNHAVMYYAREVLMALQNITIGPYDEVVMASTHNRSGVRRSGNGFRTKPCNVRCRKKSPKIKL